MVIVALAVASGVSLFEDFWARAAWVLAVIGVAVAVCLIVMWLGRRARRQ